MLEIDFELTKGEFRLRVDERLEHPRFTVIQGRSGCGKTTLLRCIAGLEPRARGYLRMAGETWQDARHRVPPHRRSVGYVPQDPTLFPHKDVRDNLKYGLERLKPAQRRLGFDDLVALLELGPLLSRRPGQLSGGQQQRVAIGRALLASPKLLLMDEPLANLDPQSKAEILPYLDRLAADRVAPVLYVTHSPQESARLADTLLVMEAGKVVGRGSAQDILTRLDASFSHRADACARIEGAIVRHDRDHALTWLEAEGQTLAVPHLAHPVGTAVALQVDARDVSLALSRATDSSIVNLVPARIEDLVTDRDPAYCIVRLRIGEAPLLARITTLSARKLDLQRGMSVIAQIKAISMLHCSRSHAVPAHPAGRPPAADGQ
jgi:molybdate transport system ATP-binding protein